MFLLTWGFYLLPFYVPSELIIGWTVSGCLWKLIFMFSIELDRPIRSSKDIIQMAENRLSRGVRESLTGYTRFIFKKIGNQCKQNISKVSNGFSKISFQKKRKNDSWLLGWGFLPLELAIIHEKLADSFSRPNNSQCDQLAKCCPKECFAAWHSSLFLVKVPVLKVGPLVNLYKL